jgi:hypothetical protein
MNNVVKFPYSASRRVHSKKAAQIKERHTGGAGRESCRNGNKSGRCGRDVSPDRSPEAPQQPVA